MKTLKKIVTGIVLSVVVLGGIFMYMLINHPYVVMNMFEGPSQQQVDKEWNQPITPTVCYQADCRK